MSDDPGLARARAVADTVLYEGYLLYPYRASSAKNHSRWQFGVLGPPGAEPAGLGEAATMTLQTVLTDLTGPVLDLRVRFLQLQRRQLYDDQGAPVDARTRDGRTELSWDEAVEHELAETFTGADLAAPCTRTLRVPGGEDVDGPVVRRRWPLAAELTVSVVPSVISRGRLALLEVHVANTGRAATDREDATRRSLIGAHLLAVAEGCGFGSVVDPPQEARELAATCRQDRCWPFLAGESGDTSLLLGSPIILYDHPEVAPESLGAMFDATEIDEILTLRVMTMTDAEKEEARATDPQARALIDRCDAMTPEALQQLHGVLRDPRAPEPPGPEPRPEPRPEPGPEPGAPWLGTDEPWWDPAADASVDPESDAVEVDGVAVAKGSLVRVHPRRRADAQDLFFADQVARVTAVLCDVDGGTHVALVLLDDPAADLHDWYGRYLYFAPDEIEPLSELEAARLAAPGTAPVDDQGNTREESRP